MHLQFSECAVLDQKSGNFKILAIAGGMQIQCVVERGAITAGLKDTSISDIQALQILETRIREIESVASQRFFNGEHSPVVKREHMFRW